MNDNEIVELYLARNEDAINQTAIKYGTRLRNIAFRIVDDSETAEECENSAYFETWKSIPPYEPREYLFAFVGRIIRHVALDTYRMNNRQKRLALYCELTQEMQECIPADNDTEAEIEADFLSTYIDEFLKMADSSFQKMLNHMHYYAERIA